MSKWKLQMYLIFGGIGKCANTFEPQPGAPRLFLYFPISLALSLLFQLLHFGVCNNLGDQSKEETFSSIIIRER